MDWTGSASFILPDSITDQTLPPAYVVDNDGILIECTNVDDILNAHEDDWNGIRYDYRRDRVDSGPDGYKSGSGGTTGVKSGSIGQSGMVPAASNLEVG